MAGYISAFRFRSLNSFYDPILRWTLRGGTFPLADAAAAHRHIHQRQNLGKVVLLAG